MSRKLGGLISGVALACLLAAVSVLVVSFACAGTPSQPTQRCVGQTDCADGNCCDAAYGCCGIFSGKEVCCPSNTPHYCRSTNLCYGLFTDAQRACGTSYVICGGVVR
jgi:hypothetical protein